MNNLAAFLSLILLSNSNGSAAIHTFIQVCEKEKNLVASKFKQVYTVSQHFVCCLLTEHGPFCKVCFIITFDQRHNQFLYGVASERFLQTSDQLGNLSKKPTSGVWLKKLMLRFQARAIQLEILNLNSTTQSKLNFFPLTPSFLRTLLP